MIHAEPSDLVKEMRTSVAEEVFLRDLPDQVTDYCRDGRTVVHGPWRAEDCQRVLLRWFDRGLIDCYAYPWDTTKESAETVHQEEAGWRSRATLRGQFLILDLDDARGILTGTSAWDREGAGDEVMLAASDSAAGLPFDDWVAALDGLPEELIYEKSQSGS